MFGGVNMLETQIYIEKHSKALKNWKIGGGSRRLSTGGESLPTQGGV